MTTDTTSSTTNGIMLQTTPDHIVERSNYRATYDQQFVETTAADMADRGYDPAYPLEVYADPDQPGNYVLIDGHTRRKSALLGATYDIKTRLPLLKVRIIVKAQPTDGEFYLKQYTANNNRVTPDEISNARALQAMLDHGVPMVEIKSRTGHAQDYIDRRLALLSLTPDIQDLVAKGQLRISFAYAIRDLDSNRQRIAVRYYNTRKPLIDEFVKFCSELLEQQIKDTSATLFDLASLESSAEAIADKISTETCLSRAELERKLHDEREARIKDRAYAMRVAARQALTIKALQAQLEALQAA